MAKDRPSIMLRKDGARLAPMSQIDAELLDGFANGDMFRADYASRRSNPQNALYWVMLGRVCEATGRWPSAEKLHRTLLIEAGFFTPVISLDGKSARLEADSTAFAAMRPDAFRAYFDRAVALLTEHCGFDPLEFYKEDAA